MENIIHLLNLVKFLTKFDEKKVNLLRNYYIQSCQERRNFVKLPIQHFGPSTICSHCGSLWTKVEHRNRLISGKTCSGSIKKIIHNAENNGWLSKYRLAFMRKFLRNKMNKMNIKCFNCLKVSKISCTKPKRQKLIRQVSLNDSDAQKFCKKKKRRSKDKSAGLNISFRDSYVRPIEIESPESHKKTDSPICRERMIIKKSVTPLEKLKGINKGRLSDILKDDGVKKRNSLNKFLKELY